MREIYTKLAAKILREARNDRVVMFGVIVNECRRLGWRFEMYSAHCVIGVPCAPKRGVVARFKSSTTLPLDALDAFQRACVHAGKAATTTGGDA